MRASSNSTPGDKARRHARTAPRRHTDPNEQTDNATYDSTEFPVLLRMPELEETKLDSVTISAVETNLELPPTSTQSPAPRTGRRTRLKGKEHRFEKPAPEAQSTTAFASKLFWGTLAPKLAVGGMLLSVTALCVVVLQGPSADKASEATESKWAVDESLPSAAAQNTSTASAKAPEATSEPAVVEPETTARHTVATRPEPIQAAAPSANQVLPTDGLVEPTPASDIAPLNLSSETPRSTEATPTAQQPFQAQGWPDDIETDASAPAADMQLQLNEATRSAQRQVPTRVNTWNRPVGDGATSVPEPAAGTRLNGTVEIPKTRDPRADYRL